MENPNKNKPDNKKQEDSILEKQVLEVDSEEKGILSNRFKLALYIVLVISIVLALMYYSVHLYSQLVDANEKRDVKYEQYMAAQEEFDRINIEMFEQRFTDTFTFDQILSMRERHLIYGVLVNNNVISSNQNVFQASTENITISFVERYEREALSIFTDNILHDYSLITEEIIDEYIRISTSGAEYSLITERLHEGRRINIVFSNVTSGEIITLEIINFDFVRRLGRNDGVIEIIYAGTQQGGN